MQTHAEKHPGTSVTVDSKTRRSAESSLHFAGSGTGGVAQKKLQQMANDSPQAQSMMAVQALANGSSRSSRHGALQGKFAPVQRLATEEEELLQGKFAPVQRLAPEEEEPLQGKFDPVQRLASEEEELLQGKFDPVQRLAPEEEEPLQGKFDPVQRLAPEEEEPLQGKFDPVQRLAPEEEELQMKAVGMATQLQADQPLRKNETGLPDNLKSGIESLSGMPLDNVRVHFNSAQPAQLNALAYAQGSDIHVAPGQEKHLPHEAWHVVQQAQGRVRPTTQMKQGVAVNDDVSLEKEADAMGARALQMQPADASVAGTQSAKMLQLVRAVTQLQPKPAATNPQLVNYINALFKAAPSGGVAVGDGSALAACSHEVNGGDQVGGRDHIHKCQDILRGVSKLLDRDENPKSPFSLSDEDYEVARALESDLQDALDGNYTG